MLELFFMVCGCGLRVAGCGLRVQRRQVRSCSSSPLASPLTSTDARVGSRAMQALASPALLLRVGSRAREEQGRGGAP